MNIGSIGSGTSMNAMQGMAGAARRGRPQGPPPELPEEMKGLDPDSPDFTQKVAENMLGSMDTDGDGTITKAESKLPDELFSKLDSGGKGSLTKDDIISGLNGIHAEMQARMQQDGQFMDMAASGGSTAMSRGIRAYRRGLESGLVGSGQPGTDQLAMIQSATQAA